jgi:hypothetical protein
MSTLANITSLNLSLQTGGAALAVNAVKSVAKPERTVYVFGTADDVAPNFTTVAGAITYAQSLVPTSTEPVVIRLFSKADGTPYDLYELDGWGTYVEEYIYIYSDFVRVNTYDSVPVFLPAGLTAWYIDPNGVETLWVGREDGSAQLVGGALVGEFTPTFVVDGGTITTAQKIKYAKSSGTVTFYGLLTLAITDTPIDGFTISNVPAIARPSVGGFGIMQVSASDPNAGNTTFFPIQVDSTGSMGVNGFDSSTISGNDVMFISITIPS